MKTLAAKISNDLENFHESYIYNSDLARVWPKELVPDEREKRIRKFAKDQGLHVDVYQIGMCAIFKKTDGKVKRLRPTRPSSSRRKRPANR
jgi:hypothetical protein